MLLRCLGILGIYSHDGIYSGTRCFKLLLMEIAPGDLFAKLNFQVYEQGNTHMNMVRGRIGCSVYY